MRTIKFRGRDVNTGEYVYGDLRIVGIRPHIYKAAHCYYEETLIEVEADSVAQLIEVDKNGNEVYENDDIYLPDGGYYINAVGTWAEADCTPFPASFAWYCEIRDGYAVLYKEAANNEND